MNEDLKIQTFLDYLENNGNLNQLTTNSDNNNAPVHRWFPFLAGFSYKLVNETIRYFDMAGNGAVIFDPFIGSGTTGVVGKEQGIEVIGNESNLFLYKICKLKTDFQVETTRVSDSAGQLLEKAYNKWRWVEIKNEKSLLKKCYPENNLKKLVALRELIDSASNIPDECKQYLFLAITMSLPKSANVGINVPYVSWTYKRKPEEVFFLFEKNIHIIEADLNKIIATYKNKFLENCRRLGWNYRKNKRKLKKSFDILTALYFRDMFLALNEIYRVMKENALAFIVIGDSAPYGVHIPTDTLLGEMAVELGFSSYTVKSMRIRGIKWRTLKYRHKKELRESLLILRK